MKAQTTAIVTIIAVLGLVLASTSAITYSWWSDSEETEITITTGTIDLEATPNVSIIGNDTSLTSSTSSTGITTTTSVGVSAMSPGDSIVLDYSAGTLESAIKTIFVITTSIAGPFTVEENVYFTDGSTNYSEKQVMVAGNYDVKGTITITLPSGIGYEYMGQQYALAVTLGVYQANIDVNEIPVDSVTQTIIANGYNDVTVSNDKSSVTISGLDSTVDNAKADVSILAGFIDNGYALAQGGEFVAGLSVKFTDGNQDGNATVTLKVDGNYTDGNGSLISGLVINHVVDGVMTPVVVTNATYADGMTTIIFNASSFSEYYLMDERCIDIDGQLYTLPEAFKIGGEMTLIRDINGPGAVLPSGCNAILDLNGYTYTFAKNPVGSAGTETLCLQLLKDSTIVIKNGTLAVDTDSGQVNFKMMINNYCNLTLNNVAVDGRGLLDNGVNYVVSNNCGDSFFTGNTKIYAADGDVAFDVYDYSSAGYELPTVTVESSVIVNGAIEATAKVGNTYYATIGNAISAASNNDTIVLYKGVYQSSEFNGLKKGMTLECSEGVVFNGQSSLNIAGATVIGATFSNDVGNAVTGTVNGVFKDCSFVGGNGLRWCYAGETVEFYDCVFSGSVYGVHFDGGANDAYFEGCTFSGFNAMASAITKLTLEDCTFKANGESDYNGINMWGDTDLIGCTFIFDGSASYEWMDACSPDKVCTFTDCTVTDGKNERDISEVASSRGGTLIIDGVAYVFNDASLDKVLNGDISTIYLADGVYTADLYNIDYMDSLIIKG